MLLYDFFISQFAVANISECMLNLWSPFRLSQPWKCVNVPVLNSLVRPFYLLKTETVFVWGREKRASFSVPHPAATLPWSALSGFSEVIVLERELPRAQRDEAAPVWNQIQSGVMGSAWRGVLDALAQANGLAGSERPDCPLCAATARGV